MGDWVSVQDKCRFCNGTGIYQDGAPVPDSCPYCLGEGYEEAGRVKMKDVLDKLDQILTILNTP